MRAASLVIVAALALLPLAGLFAAETQPQADTQPFAEHHLALQLSDNDPRKEALIISIAYNMLKVYGPDRVAIEVVTFGPGIDLLKADNTNRQRVDSLVSQGVKFDVCGKRWIRSNATPGIGPRSTRTLWK